MFLTPDFSTNHFKKNAAKAANFLDLKISYFLVSRYFCHSQVVRKASSKVVSAFQLNSFSAVSAFAYARVMSPARRAQI